MKNKTQLEWLQRERDKVKDRIAIVGDNCPVTASQYRTELSELSQRILALDPTSASR